MNRCSHLLVLVLGLLLVRQPLQAQTIVRPILLPSGKRKAGTVIVQFLSGGHIDTQGRGLAVVDEDQAPQPYHILAHDPESQTTLAVDVRNSHGQLYLKYSRMPLPDARRDNKVAASLVLRTYALGRGTSPNLENLSRQLRRTLPLGTSLVRNISLAHNPFGESTYFVTYFEGLLSINKPQTLKLFSANDDAAEVMIDGKILIHNPSARRQRHSEQLAEQATSIRLEPGTHRLSYLHTQTTGGTLALLGYINNGRALPLPANMFVHHPMAKLGEAQPSGDLPIVGFDARQLDQMAHDEYVFTRVELTPIAPAPENTRYRWDFGEGTTAQAGKIEHVFVSPTRSWQVKLELINKKGRVVATATSRLRPVVFGSSHTIGNQNLVWKYAGAIGSSDYSNAPRQVIEALYSLAAATERLEFIAPLAEPYVQRFGRTTGKIDGQMKYSLASYLAAEEPQRAAEMFGELAQEAKDSWLGTCAAAEQLDLLIFRLGDTKKLMAIRSISQRARTDRERALLRARFGDIHRLNGDMEKARQAYLAAQQISMRRMDPRRAAVLSQAHRQTALSYLQQKRFPALRDILFQWEADFPSAKLQGDLPLITGRYFQAVGNDARAVQEFRTVLELNPLHPNRPEIAFRLAQSLARLGQKEQAKLLFDEIAEKYPNSPFAKEALRAAQEL